MQCQTTVFQHNTRCMKYKEQGAKKTDTKGKQQNAEGRIAKRRGPYNKMQKAL